MTKIKIITIKSPFGMELQLTTLGATIISLKVPDKNGKLVNVAVGLKSPSNYLAESYLSHNLLLGSTVGRYAGRISNGGFKIENKWYKLHHENGVHLHGGKVGFDKKYWNIEHINEVENPSVTLTYCSPHLEEGYPSNLNVSITYELTADNALKITHKATTDFATQVNLTNHSYFNLDGEGSILDHELVLNSSSYLDVDDQLVPTGKINECENTRFDFRLKSVIGRSDFKGFDDTFILGDKKCKATLSSDKTGIEMHVYTNHPAMVIYTREQFPDLEFYRGAKYSKFPAICFVAQNFPDAPNHSNFPSAILNPGETYLNETMFKFNS